MAVIQALVAAVGRSLGRILNTAFGWATIMLFGKVPQERQIYLSGAAFGSVLWLIALLGVAFPSFATWLLSFVRLPPWVNPNWVRLGMLAAAALLPLVVGGLSFVMADRSRREAGAARLVLRGYPYTLGLALTLVLMLIFAPLARLRDLVRRRGTVHVPVIVEEDDYGTVLEAVRGVLRRNGLGVERAPAPGILRFSMRLLSVLAGRGSRARVAEELSVLRAPNAEVLVHPADLVIAAPEMEAARIRALLSQHLAFTPAYFTYSREANEMEDALRGLWERVHDGAPAASAETELRALEGHLETMRLSYEEWEVLFRQVLLLDRAIDHRRAEDARVREGGAVDGALRAIGRRLLHTAARVVTEALHDEGV